VNKKIPGLNIVTSLLLELRKFHVNIYMKGNGQTHPGHKLTMFRVRLMDMGNSKQPDYSRETGSTCPKCQYGHLIRHIKPLFPEQLTYQCSYCGYELKNPPENDAANQSPDSL
jgi:hypothetical protein